MVKANELNYSQYLIHGQSSGDNLWGFEFDVQANIFKLDDYRFVFQERSDNPNCMLTLQCKFAHKFNYQQIAEYIESQWLKYICYQDFEKHYIEIVNDELHFYYVTTSKLGLGVTGKIVVS